MKRFLCILILSVMCLTAVSPALAYLYAEAGEVNTISGETERYTENIRLPDGTDTGVKCTEIILDGKYGNKVVHAIEADLSNTHLSIDVINCGTYMVSTEPVADAVEKYTEANDGKTVLAAVNGDLWLTNIHSNDQVTTSTLKAPRGVTIVNREVWSTEQIGMENYVATNSEKGTTSPPKTAFGITSDNRPVVGSPVITTEIKNETTGKTLIADGINRLPAWDSLIVYNYRVNISNYALNDAYEIELEVDDSSAFTIGGRTSATVKAIFPSGSKTRPAIREKTIIITARGKKMEDVKDISIGDTLTFELSVEDRYGHTDMWEDVVSAIGGHMTALLDGALEQSIGGGEYPSTIIGYKDNGNVLICTVSYPDSGVYKGLKLSQAYDFCCEMGYNSVFFLDGGGSATMVTLDAGEYTVRNECSDGIPRSVINSVGIVWNDTPVCKKQGSLSYIDVPLDLSEINPTYIDGALMSSLMSGENQVKIAHDKSENAMVMSTTGEVNNDPYATLNYTGLSRVNAEDYPYVVLKVKTAYSINSTLSLFFATGERNGADANYAKSMPVGVSEDWQYIVFDFTGDNRWNGRLNNTRIDIFDNSVVDGSAYMKFGAIALCKNTDEVEAIKSGNVPDGVITDFLEYKEQVKPRFIDVMQNVEGGTVRLDKNFAKVGETVTVTLLPLDRDHFVKSVTAMSGGDEINLVSEDENGGKYTFVMPQNEVTLNVEWGSNLPETEQNTDIASETDAATEQETDKAADNASGKAKTGILVPVICGIALLAAAIILIAVLIRKKHKTDNNS